MSWSTSELRVRLAPLNRFKPSSKIFYWPFQGGTSFVDLLCFWSVLCLLCFVHVCLYMLCGHLLGKGWPLGSRLWCLLWVCHFPIGILGQVWYLIVSIPDLCTITYLNCVYNWYISTLRWFKISRISKIILLWYPGGSEQDKLPWTACPHPSNLAYKTIRQRKHEFDLNCVYNWYISTLRWFKMSRISKIILLCYQGGRGQDKLPWTACSHPTT